MDTAAVGGLVVAAAAAAGGLGFTLSWRLQRAKLIADTGDVHAETSSRYALAAQAAIDPLTRQVEAMKALQVSLEEEIARHQGEIQRLTLALMDATSSTSRMEREVEGVRRNAQMARELATAEIATVRAQLEASEAQAAVREAEYRREVGLIHDEHAAEIADLRRQVVGAE